MNWAKTWLRVVMAVVCAVAAGQAVSKDAGGTAKGWFRYDVVSIRQSKGNAGGYGELPDGFWMKGLTLRSLIPDAYGVVRDDQVVGWPDWTAFTQFDIEAKMDAETVDALHKLPKDQQEAQRQLMLQSLMANRFRLKVHRGSEVRTTYELVLAKGGPKMKEDNPPTDMNGIKWQEGVTPAVDWRIADGSINGHAMPISNLVVHLQGAVGAIIVNKTGLTGRYDVGLRWHPKAQQDPTSTEPSIFTAVEEQLGLRLKPAKTAVETIVIDHLEMPSEN